MRTLLKANKPPFIVPSAKGPQTRKYLLPPELFRLIIEWVSNSNDLCNICLASRICRFEADRILYRTIDLPQNTQAPVLWARTILGSPQKAMAVRSRTLRFDLAFLILPHKLLPSLQQISRALRALPNLRELYLFGHKLVMMHPVHLWLLDGCVPKLEVFHNHLFLPSGIAPFLSRQHNIRQWKQTGLYLEREIELDILPLATDIDIHASALSFFTTPRPLQHLRLRMDHFCDGGRKGERETIKRLSLFGPTLESLVIENTNPDYLATTELLGLLADATPNLKILSYSHSTPCSQPNYEDCIPLVQDLYQLEVLTLPSGHTGSAALFIPIARSFLTRCPSLRCPMFKATITHLYQKQQDGRVIEGAIPALSIDAEHV